MQLFKQNYVKYGLLMTGVLVLCLLIMEITGENESFENKSPILIIYQFIMPAVIWYLGLRAKKNLQKGRLTFRDGILEAFKISVVFGIVSPIVFGAYYLFINPGILDYVRSTYGMPYASDSTILAIDLFAQFISAIVFGTLYGAIISFFLKHKS